MHRQKEKESKRFVKKKMEEVELHEMRKDNISFNVDISHILVCRRAVSLHMSLSDIIFSQLCETSPASGQLQTLIEFDKATP